MGIQVSQRNAGAIRSSGSDGCTRRWCRVRSLRTISRTKTAAMTIHSTAPSDQRIVSVQPAQSKKPPHMKTIE